MICPSAAPPGASNWFILLAISSLVPRTFGRRNMFWTHTLATCFHSRDALSTRVRSLRATLGTHARHHLCHLMYADC